MRQIVNYQDGLVDAGDGHLFSRAQGTSTTHYTLDIGGPAGLVECQ